MPKRGRPKSKGKKKKWIRPIFDPGLFSVRYAGLITLPVFMLIASLIWVHSIFAQVFWLFMLVFNVLYQPRKLWYVSVNFLFMTTIAIALAVLFSYWLFVTYLIWAITYTMGIQMSGVAPMLKGEVS